MPLPVTELTKCTPVSLLSDSLLNWENSFSLTPSNEEKSFGSYHWVVWLLCLTVCLDGCQSGRWLIWGHRNVSSLPNVQPLMICGEHLHSRQQSTPTSRLGSMSASGSRLHCQQNPMCSIEPMSQNSTTVGRGEATQFTFSSTWSLSIPLVVGKGIVCLHFFLPERIDCLTQEVRKDLPTFSCPTITNFTVSITLHQPCSKFGPQNFCFRVKQQDGADTAPNDRLPGLRHCLKRPALDK